MSCFAICGDSPVGRGIVMLQDQIAGAPLLRAMSAHSVAEAFQKCFVEFFVYRPSSRDVFMTNQPVNVEERNQHGLDIGLQLPFFGRGDEAVFQWDIWLCSLVCTVIVLHSVFPVCIYLQSTIQIRFLNYLGFPYPD